MDQRLVILLDPGAASNDYLRHDKSKEKRFAFDQAFDAETGNQRLFEATTQPLIGSIVQGFNCSVFAYGSTGAGKTFTMIGTEQEPGVMSRTVDSLFAEFASDPSVSVVCCFVEVYNEVLRDLGSQDGKEGMCSLLQTLTVYCVARDCCCGQSTLIARLPGLFRFPHRGSWTSSELLLKHLEAMMSETSPRHQVAKR